jgi:hypothetical protein
MRRDAQLFRYALPSALMVRPNLEE